MISIFRKEMKKWHSVLWAVFISLAASGLSFLFLHHPHGDDAVVARVNKETIPLKEFKISLAGMNARVNMLREYAGLQGISIELLMKMFFGSTDLASLALDQLIKDALLNTIHKSFNVQLSDSYLKEQLVKMMPPEIAHENGTINMNAYQAYVERLGLAPAEFEHMKEEELKRECVTKIIGASYYVPSYLLKDQYDQEKSKKSFAILQFPLSMFVKEAESYTPSAEELQSYFDTHKEAYKIPEKKKVSFVRLNIKSYENKVDIEDSAVQLFYDKNKASLYRIPPQISVRHILISAQRKDAQKLAHDILTQVQENKDQFIHLAKQHSDDKETAKNGGLIKLFSRGTFDREFEKAAFSLMNKGDISKVIKTAKGFEIIMLEERVNAVEKPLEDVRDDIIKLLRSKKASSSLKSELEGLMHTLKTDELAFENFVKKHDAKISNTEWLNATDQYEDELINKIAQKVFSSKGGSKKIGYFNYHDEYILFNVIAIEKSYVPEMTMVADNVKKDFITKRAKDQQRLAVKEAKRAIFNKENTLTELSKLKGFPYAQTKLLKISDKIDGLEGREGSDLLKKAFILNDSTQLFEHEEDSVFYIFQLVNSEKEYDQLPQEELDKMRSKETLKAAHLQINSFIASLQRNAKIEVDNNLMNAFKSM